MRRAMNGYVWMSLTCDSFHVATARAVASLPAGGCRRAWCCPGVSNPEDAAASGQPPLYDVRRVLSSVVVRPAPEGLSV